MNLFLYNKNQLYRIKCFAVASAILIKETTKEGV